MTIADGYVESIREINAKTPDLRTDFMAGRIRAAGGKLNLSQNQTGVFQLLNPSGSGKIITVWNFSIACDMNVDVFFGLDGTLGGTPVTHEAFAPNRAVPVSTVAIARSTTGGATGGTVLSPVYRIPANFPVEREFNVVLLPSQSVSARISMGALNTAQFYVAATWSEDPT